MPRSTALVVVRSHLARDPRPRRQIEWLTGAGWQVDSIALGPAVEGTRDHFELASAPHWARSRLGRAAMHALLPSAAKFRLLGTSRVPRAALDRLRAGAYDLVVLNDIDFAPWVADRRLLPPGGAHVHLDVHEYFPPHLPPGSRLRIRVDSYHRYLRSFIGASRIDSRSVVSPSIARAYALEFGIPEPGIVRSAPAFAELTPSPVEPGRLRVIHHGSALWARGLREIVDAMRLVGDHVELTLMLVGSEDVIAGVRRYAADLGARVRIVPPVPVPDIAREINAHDLEVMFFPPSTRNLEWALPNKLFEAVQGRLGLVIGPSREMVAIVEHYGNGVVAAGWTAEDLAAVLAPLSDTEVAALKAASDRAAVDLNAQREGEQFLRLAGVGA
jgi:hypothetical protein